MLKAKKELQTPLIQIYEKKCQSEYLKYDAKQADIINELEHLRSEIVNTRFFRFPQKTTSQGIYLYGSVGSGKSMIMDLFYNNVNIEKKSRTHFHNFMQQVHDEIHKWRLLPKKSKESALTYVAKKISQNTKLLCFDEFQVNDVADALILGQLFSKLFKFKTFVIATSNRHPDELYLGGIQREKFLEFVELFKNKLQIKKLVSNLDYRKIALKSLKQTYFYPDNKQNKQTYDDLFKTITANAETSSKTIKYKGRLIHLDNTVDTIAKIKFPELFETNLNSSDYQQIASLFQEIFLTEVRQIDIEESNIAKRFINFIDVCYENKTKLIILAKCPEELIYPNGKFSFEFSRTISRLKEMQSSNYLSE